MRRHLLRVGAAATVAACLAFPARAQQRVSPVTINPGAGGGLGAGGLNITVPSYGPTVVYTPPFGGYYGGYGGYYGGGVAVVSSGGWGAPIPGYGGYGFGPFGYNNTNNPASSFEDPVERQQRIALANSRYDLQTAQTAKAYAEANYFQQQAMAAAQQNEPETPPAPVREKYNVRTTTARSRPRASTAAPKVPLDQLMTPEGQIKWPAAAPADAARARVDDAIGAIAKQFKQDGKASVQSVNEARDALYAFGLPALADVRKTKPSSGPEFKDFLNGLDAALTGMAGK